ncbi:MAG: NAD(P)-dependent oxidoreductase [Pseudomonadota bacterium]
MDRIGFIGLGAMGHGMAANILARHGAVMVLGHRNRAPVEDLVANGAKEANSPAALAKACDVILLCLPNSDVVERMIEDMGESLSAGKTLIDTGTSSRESTLNLHKTLQSRGVHFAESPLTGGTLQAQNAELGALVGADLDVFERIEPILGMFCATVQHFGPVGSGAAAKFVNNYMVMGVAAVVCEAFHVARLTDSDWGKLYDVVIRGSADSGVFRRIIGNAKDGNYEGYVFSVENALKDMGYISEMNGSLGRNTALNKAIHAFFKDAVEAGQGPKLLSELMRPEIAEILFKRQD